MKMKIKSSVSNAELRDILRRLATPPQMEWWEGTTDFSVIRTSGREGGWRWDRGVVANEFVS